MRRFASGVLLILLLGEAPVFAQATVQRLDVQVVYETETPHAVVQERLHAAVASTAERLLVGRPLEQAMQLQPRLAEAMAGVLGRVITGYTVVAAVGDIGAVTAVVVRLRPDGQVIREATVRVDLREVPTRLHALIPVLLQPVVDQVRALPRGLPVAADWAYPLLEGQAQTLLEGGLAGYTAAVTLRAAPQAVVDAALRPRDTRLIRNIGVHFRSSSLPSLLLDPHAPAVASLGAFLRGVPVAFAVEHRSALERILTDDLRAYPPVQQYRIVATPVLQVGETTFITVIADSLTYRASVEAHLNMGSGAPGPALIARAGRLVASPLDAFAEIRVVPNTLSFDWDLGAGLAVSPTTTLGFSYTVTTGAISLWTSVGVSRDIIVRGTWNTSANSYEAAVRYRLNDFLAWEVVGVPGQVWVRLVSSL